MIKLCESKGFEILPEGKTVLKVTDVEYDADFGKMIISLVNKAGIAHKERYNLINTNGEVNEKSLGAFSYFARKVLNDNDIMEIDEQELVGKYISVTVKHEKREGKGQYEGKTYTNARLNDYESASGFGDEASTFGTPVSGNVDIDF